MTDFSDLQREFKVYFDPDIDDFEQFSAHVDNANASDSSGMFYCVYGYDNSLEKDTNFRNPVERVYSLKSLSDADKKALIINLKTVCRKAITEIGFRIIARQLFFAVNSLIDGKNEFKTVQQAYAYALSGKEDGCPIIEANEFLDVAKLHLYAECVYRSGIKKYVNFPTLLEIKILVDLCNNYNTRYNMTTLESIFIDIDNNNYGCIPSSAGERTVTNTLLDDSVFSIDGHTIIDKSSFASNGQNTGYLDDFYNNVRLRNVVKKAKNADKAYKTLEFQRFIGAEPSLLPAFGTIFCRYFAVYEMFYQNSGYKVVNSTCFNDILECIENDNSELNATISTIIKNNNVKAPDSSLNSEICSYVKTISSNDFERISSYTLHKTDYYNGIVLFLINKIKHYYDGTITQDAINTIAAIIYYYLRTINKAHNAIIDKLDNIGTSNSGSLYGGRKNYVDSNKFSKIIENMVENEDFCSYPIEFCVEKAKMLYFSD